jgi:hypothetical protein
MWYVGIDLGRRSLYVAAVHDSGKRRWSRSPSSVVTATGSFGPSKS